eukprot:CAMPEP_0173441630 /NCGR_PEP_ID=MMETSP1357-20121228/24062_1 /TAXON_ID=77926 /ORGANISM="Hemiselmis rufescens, Strain PCC563" /LENGTH=61 /DNA_ID=CAMNT_0014407221 /DNA_START=151 /DNA_END=332 /DNA_ORIENTATION=+
MERDDDEENELFFSAMVHQPHQAGDRNSAQSGIFALTHHEDEDDWGDSEEDEDPDGEASDG